MPHHALVGSTLPTRSAEDSLEWLFRDSVQSVLDSTRAGYLSDDEARVLLSQLIAVAMERRLTGMMSKVVSSYLQRYRALSHRRHA